MACGQLTLWYFCDDFPFFFVVAATHGYVSNSKFVGKNIFAPYENIRYDPATHISLIDSDLNKKNNKTNLNFAALDKPP